MWSKAKFSALDQQNKNETDLKKISIYLTIKQIKKKWSILYSPALWLLFTFKRIQMEHKERGEEEKNNKIIMNSLTQFCQTNRMKKAQIEIMIATA